MERNKKHFEDSPFMFYLQELWLLRKKKIKYITFAFLGVILLIDGFIGTFKGIGSPTGNTYSISEVGMLYPFVLLACSLTASLGTGSSNLLSARKLSTFKEWSARWLFFVAAPTLLYIFFAHFIDAVFLSVESQPMPWEVMLDDISPSYILAFIFFSTSFFFLISLYLPRYTFFLGVPIVALAMYIVESSFVKYRRTGNLITDLTPTLNLIFIGIALFLLLLSYNKIKSNKKEDYDFDD